MIAAAQWARENDIPYLGICLGMQIAVIEFARHVCGVKAATSEEFSKEKGSPKITSIANVQDNLVEQTNGLSLQPVSNGPNGSIDVNIEKSNNLIIFMPEIDKSTMGGTMRLGRRATHFQEQHSWSKLRPFYDNKKDIHERHRHRYEVNPAWVPTLEESGLSFVGKDDENMRMEVVEIKKNKWFVGVQFHPEYLSRVLKPSRPYLGFVAACAGVLDQVTREELDLATGQVNGTSDTF